MGEAPIHCCGVALPPLEAEECDGAHDLTVEDWDGERYVTTHHSMRRDHYLSFVAQVTDWGVDIVKLWPEMPAEAYFLKRSGMLYAYCNKHGLFRVKV